MTQEQREIRKLKRALRHLTDSVLAYTAWMDREMAKPSDATRGARIAHATNALDFANDQARYFGLGVDYRTDDKAKERARCLKKATVGARERR